MLIELSYEFHEGIPIYPGSPPEKFQPHTLMDKGEDANTTLITHYIHNGSHVDAPFHFYNKGATIEQIPIEDFVYERPLVIDKALNRSQLLRVEDLTRYGAGLHEADIILFHTGYCRLRGDRGVYTDDFPAVARTAAEYIRTELLNVKAVAIDTLSIESAVLGPKQSFEVHKTFMDGDLYPTRPLLVYEDINVGLIAGKSVKRIYAFPLRLRGLDGSPVNVVAETME